MDFKELINMNKDAEEAKFLRVAKAKKELEEQMNDFFNSLNKDMLVAISKYGKPAHKIRGTVHFCREFENEDSCNNLHIIATDNLVEPYHIGDRVVECPGTVYVLSGSYGIRAYSYDQKPSIVDSRAVFFDMSRSEYNDEILEQDAWIESGFRPDMAQSHLLPKREKMMLTGARMAGDERTWFERARDALPRFEKELALYLENRAKGMK